MGSPPTKRATRPIWWDGDRPTAAVCVIDQRRLPGRLVVRRWRTVDDAIDGIHEMEVRGAPLIGVAAAHGLALAARADATMNGLRRAARALRATRPTAVNLGWALDGCLGHASGLAPAARTEGLRHFAQQLADDDAEQCRRIGEVALPLLRALHRSTGRAVNVLTHCNAGRLACIEYGTATAPVYVAAQNGIPVHVWVSETRPRNQGAALTAWELAEAGIDHTLVVDNAASHLMARGDVDLVIVGADRVVRNGDVANKIGTALKAFAAAEHGIPFYVAIPWSTFDAGCATGAEIPIEERSADEVLTLGGRRIAPPATPARNWGFDVTPARAVTGYLTPDGVLTAPELVRRAARP